MERWKDIPGYEGIYQASTYGRIWSYPKKGSGGHKGKVLKQTIDSQGKYLSVRLRKNKKGKTFLVHRLIAEAFIENPENKRTVNHKNGDKLNNFIENLEWNTYSENIKHSFNELGRINPMQGIKGKLHHGSKKIKQMNMEGKLIKIWNSISDANRYYGLTHNHISSCCSGKRKTILGYKWKYYDD